MLNLLFPTLPNELLDIIINLIGNAYQKQPPKEATLDMVAIAKTLGNLALTSRYIAERCRVHFFRLVYLHPPVNTGKVLNLYGPQFPAGLDVAFDNTIALFQRNPALFQHVKVAAIALRLADTPAVAESLAFFLGGLPELGELRVSAATEIGRRRPWGNVSDMIRVAVHRCINDKNVKRLAFHNIDLPRNIFDFLPNTLEGIHILESYPERLPLVLQTRSTASKGSLPFSPKQMALKSDYEESFSYAVALKQPSTFYSRLVSLSVGVSDSSHKPFFDLVLRMPSKTLQVLLLTYRAHFTEFNLRLLAPRSDSPLNEVMPNLTSLILNFAWAIDSPSRSYSLAGIPALISSHFVPAFSKIQKLEIQFTCWVSKFHISNDTDFLGLAFIERQGRGFAPVDEALSGSRGDNDGRGIFPDLSSFRIHVNLTMLPESRATVIRCERDVAPPTPLPVIDKEKALHALRQKLVEVAEDFFPITKQVLQGRIDASVL